MWERKYCLFVLGTLVSFGAPLLSLLFLLPACSARACCPPSGLLLESSVSFPSFASFVAALPVVGAVSSLSLCPAPSAPSTPVGFVPASVSLGARLVPSSRFLPVGSGVVSALSWDAARGAVVAVVGGRRLVCLVAALGGAGSADSVALVAALRAARRGGWEVQVWGAPGVSGRVASGYFCGFEDF